MPSRADRWVLMGLCMLAFGLRVGGLELQSLWRDEVDSIRFATRPLPELLHAFSSPGQNGPLYHVLLRPWLAAAGDSEFALRYLSVLAGVLTVPLVYRLARWLFPPLRGLALVAVLLTVTSPYLVWYSQEGKMYALVVVLVLVSLDRLFAAMAGTRWQPWLAYVLSTAAAFYLHLTAALMVPVQAGIFLLQGKRTTGLRWKAMLASMAVLTVPYLPLLAWQVPLLLTPGETGFQFVPLPEMLLSLFQSYSLGVLVTGAAWSLAPFGAAILAAGWLLTDRSEYLRSLLTLLLWLFLPVAGLFLVSSVRPLYTARYLIFVLPAYLLLLAAGVVAVGRHSRALAWLLMLTLLALNGWNLWRQATSVVKADFRAATGYVVGRLGPDDLVLFQIPYGRHSFEYYLEQAPPSQPATRSFAAPLETRFTVMVPLVIRGGMASYRWAEGLYTNAGMTPEEVAQRMAEVVSGSQVVWLVASEAWLWDEHGLVQKWLDDHAELSEVAQFTRVTIYRYELP